MSSLSKCPNRSPDSRHPALCRLRLSSERRRACLAAGLCLIGREVRRVEEVGFAVGTLKLFGDELGETGEVGSAECTGVDIVSVEVFFEGLGHKFRF